MTLLYTETALASLEDALEILRPNVSFEKLIEIRDNILNRADQLVENPLLGQKEEYLAHLNKGHRRLIEGNYKIIYRLEGEQVVITDIFDCRQDTAKMKA